MKFSPDLESESLYREHPAINYSLLKSIDSSVHSLVSETKANRRAMQLGSGVDILLTQDKKAFEERFEVYKNTPAEPSLKMKKLFAACNTWEEVLPTAKEQKFGGNWTDETRLAKLEEFKEWFELMLIAREKDIITPAEQDKIFKAATTIKAEPFLNEIFTTPHETYFQFPVLSTIDGIEYKILIDFMIVDHKRKIIWPFDIKTHDKSYKNYVANAFFHWRHDIQSSLYRHVLINRFPDYTVEDFVNIVYSFSTDLVVKANTKNYFEKARDGYKRKGVDYKGWKELTDDYLWHMETQKFDYSRQVYESNGEIVIC